MVDEPGWMSEAGWTTARTAMWDGFDRPSNHFTSTGCRNGMSDDADCSQHFGSTRTALPYEADDSMQFTPSRSAMPTEEVDTRNDRARVSSILRRVLPFDLWGSMSFPEW